MDQKDDYQKTLTTRLFNNIVTHADPNLIENYVKYFNRILNSRLNVTTSSETNILSMIFDKANKINLAFPQEGKGKLKYDKVERLQNIYSILCNKKTLKRRSAVLYLLLRISQDNNEDITLDSSRVLQAIFGLQNENSNERIFYGKDDLSGNMNMNMNMNLNNLEQKTSGSLSKAIQQKISTVVVNAGKSSRIITEKDLINDLLFVFQGIDGHYINYNSIHNAYSLNSLIPFNDNVYDIVSVLAELGWLYKKVSNYVTFFNESNIPSQFIQSFSYAVQEELNEYYKLISLFKKMNSKVGEAKENEKPDELTLKKLLLWTLEPIDRMKWLGIACEAIYTLRGTPIISQLYSYVKFSGAEPFLSKVLEETSKPLFVFIRNWMLYGELQDPYKEFFVDINEKVADDDIWNSKYSLIIKNIPNLLNKNISSKIFEIGKCVNFIRKYCNEGSYSLTMLKNKISIEIEMGEGAEKEKEKEKEKKEQPEKMDVDYIQPNIPSGMGMIKIDDSVENQNKGFKKTTTAKKADLKSYKNCLKLLMTLEDDTKTNMSLLHDLISEIDLIHSEINKELLGIIYTKFHFRENLKAINRYLLLGQGDMMQYLMDLLFEELKKPVSHIYKHNLLSTLETAIRASNAQFNDPECLKKLNIKLLDASTGDTGWDIFVLEYNVDIPLNIIFTRPLLKEYQKLFFFFWKLKRLEYSQDHQIWRNFMTYSHNLKSRFEHIRPFIQKSMLFNQEVIHFVSNLHNYIALEVLETQYKKLLDKLPTIEKLDELIEIHKKFVENVIEQSLLNQESSLIYKKIIQIFDLIFRFKTAQDVLITTLLEEYYNKLKTVSFSESSHENFNRSSDIKFSKEAYNQISLLFNEFKTDITDLINTIELLGKGNLKFLSMKLDFNYYYSEREIENIHRRHGGEGDDIGFSKEKEEDDEGFHEDPQEDIEGFHEDPQEDIEAELGEQHQTENNIKDEVNENEEELKNKKENENEDEEEIVMTSKVNLKDFRQSQDNLGNNDNDDDL